MKMEELNILVMSSNTLLDNIITDYLNILKQLVIMHH
jgi:hypothetical protein